MVTNQEKIITGENKTDERYAFWGNDWYRCVLLSHSDSEIPRVKKNVVQHLSYQFRWKEQNLVFLGRTIPQISLTAGNRTRVSHAADFNTKWLVTVKQRISSLTSHTYLFTWRQCIILTFLLWDYLTLTTQKEETFLISKSLIPTSLPIHFILFT